MDMEVLVVIFVVAVAVFVVFAARTSRKRDEFTHLGARLDEFSRQLDARMRDAVESADHGQKRMVEALTAVTGHLGEQREALARIVDLQRDLKRFQDLLQPPKARGGIGERLLDQILGDFLTEGDQAGQYERQVALRGGERVDFLLRLKDFSVPIDAKFPLEAFERLHAAETDDDRARAFREFRAAVKQHIDAVARKYIRPDEGTSDFALLYFPSESVYLTFAQDAELAAFAEGRKVIVVSPGTFYLYLRTVLIGLRGFAIEASAKEVLAAIGRLEQALNEFGERFRVVGGHLRNAGKAFDEAERQLSRLGDFVTKWSKR